MSDLDKYRRYFNASGYLFFRFNRLENQLSTMLKQHLSSNFSNGIDKRSFAFASAIYGSMRYSKLKDTIKRLMPVDELSEEKVCFIKKLFSQVEHVATLRDILAHQLVEPAHTDLGADWQVSDMTTTRNLEEIKVWVFDTKSVQLAAGDLSTAAKIIDGQKATSTLLEDLDDFTAPNWQYQPSMLRLVPHDELCPPAA